MSGLTLLRLTAQTLRRQRTRTVLTVIGLAALILTYVTVQSLVSTLEGNVSATVSSLGGEIDIWSKGAPYPLVSKIPESYAAVVRNITGVTLAAPVALSLLTVDSDEAVVTGIVPSQIPSLFNYTLVAGHMITSNQSGILSIGKSFSETIRKSAGNNVQLNGQTFSITGIYQTNSWLDYSIIIPHLVAQTIIGMQNGTSMIVANTKDPRNIDSVINQIRTLLPSVEAFRSSQVPLRVSPILESVQSVATDIIAIVTGGAILGIMNSNLNNLRERMRAFAIFKATGASYSQIVRLVLYESALLGGMGTLLGLAISYGVLRFISIPVTDTIKVSIFLLPSTFLYAALFGISVSLASAVYPALRAARARPQEVFRFG